MLSSLCRHMNTVLNNIPVHFTYQVIAVGSQRELATSPSLLLSPKYVIVRLINKINVDRNKATEQTEVTFTANSVFLVYY